MAKQSAKVRTTFNIINIKLRQPNEKESTPKQYADFFIKMATQGKRIKISSELGASVRRPIRQTVGGREIIFGFLARYIIIEDGKWLDVKDPEAEETEVKIPDGMAANSKQTVFYFLPENHRLALKTGPNSLSATQAKRFFERAFRAVLAKGQTVEIDVAPSEVQYQRITESKSLSRLDIVLTYSNNDMTSDFAALIEKELKNTNSGRWHITATAEKGELLDLRQSSVLQGALELARDNGKVTATEVEPSGRKTKIEPETSPRKETVISDQPSDLLRDISTKLLQLYPRPTQTTKNG